MCVRGLGLTVPDDMPSRNNQNQWFILLNSFRQDIFEQLVLCVLSLVTLLTVGNFCATLHALGASVHFLFYKSSILLHFSL